MANVGKRTKEQLEQMKSTRIIQVDFPSIKVQFKDEIKIFYFDSISKNGKIRFLCETIKDGVSKKRYNSRTLYTNDKGYFFRIKNKRVDVTEAVQDFIKRFELPLPTKLIAVCPICKTPLQYQWRDNVNAVFEYITPAGKGIGDYRIEREYNMEAGNFDFVYCPNCEFTEANIKKVKTKVRKKMSKRLEGNIIDVLEIDLGGMK